MFTHNIIHKTLLTAVVLSMTSLASAHNFPKPAKAPAATERAACEKAMKTGASKQRTVARFGPETAVTTGSYRTNGGHRFGGSSPVSVVACTRPMRSHVACL
jgi:hypothetical protein